MQGTFKILMEISIHVDLLSLIALAPIVLLLIWSRSTHLNECVLVWLLKLCDTASLVVLLMLVGGWVVICLFHLWVLAKVGLRILP